MMEKEYIIRRIAGSMIIVGVVLAYLVSIYWLLLPLFVGINLLQSSFTKFCPLDLILKKKK
ncbi:YgaP family membrane protein [Prevotella herbatica]|uniref:YgaP family membrane protein n=2 Tax=Prevotella TaxID=838 RepID=UPI00293D3516|nr:DUF2892 domain-containing protein [Prevotella herbatica]